MFGRREGANNGAGVVWSGASWFPILEMAGYDSISDPSPIIRDRSIFYLIRNKMQDFTRRFPGVLHPSRRSVTSDRQNKVCITIYFYSECFFSILQQLVILNSVFIVKFPVVVLVVYVASSLMNKDEYMRRHRKTLTYLRTYLPEPRVGRTRLRILFRPSPFWKYWISN